MKQIRILLADDHDVVRKGLTLVLRQEPDFAVVGEARDGAEAVARARELTPDVAILDLKMPRMDGATAARAIGSEQAGTRVLILSGAELDEDVLDVLEAGVDGYVSKDASPADLARAIRSVAEGRPYYDAGLMRTLLARGAAGPAPSPARPPGAALTPREMEVLRLLATPATYRQIGEELFISEETVRSHVKSILAKLEQPNRTQAVVAAVRQGLIRLD